MGPSQAMLRIVVAGNVDDAVGVLGLDDGAFLDEEAGQLDGFIQRAAAVAPQVHDEAADVLLLEPVEQGQHVGRGALGARLAAVLHIRVEGGKRDPAEPDGRTAVGAVFAR